MLHFHETRGYIIYVARKLPSPCHLNDRMMSLGIWLAIYLHCKWIYPHAAPSLLIRHPTKGSLIHYPTVFLSFSTGLSGASIGSTAYDSLGQSAKGTSQMFKHIANTITKWQQQIYSLTAVGLQNRRALVFFTTVLGGTWLFLQKECCYYINQSLQVQEDIRSLIAKTIDLEDKDKRPFWWSPLTSTIFQ